ncbi:probable disease resistance protein At5g66900 [Rosa rugosa]|uniref:probable disease resistance protein At5g66900 n=1 Tax=Rosa rugosa TaxID=74645 RepID=UPI002B41212A|nr:probable disease resistance protein At5g66900 [Rosa rugosa]XP_062018525.1 probable disease resistance protein At5g66900 [Rosa rugosa]XP_062018526.1 probable disease resistance protein At5g66900 [Rosa rugosa]
MPINVAEFVGGAGLGSAFSILTSGVQELISKAAMFEPLFKSIQSTLIALDSLVPDTDEPNPAKKLEGLEEVRKMGEKLVSDCKEVSEWNLFAKYYFAVKLLEWNDFLKHQLRIHQLREGKNTASMVEKTASTVEKTAVSVDSVLFSVKNIEKHVILNKAATSSSISITALQPPKLPQHIVGLDTPLMELKKMLLTDHGVSMLVLTAPGGCGKTTLATMFCEDEQVKEKFGCNIFFITVSQKGNLDLIVQRLCEYTGRVPTFVNEVYSIQLLQTILKEVHNPSLLVLDDVWSGSESILDKFNRFKTSNFKILVTSRSEFRRFGSSYHLRMLDDKDAMDLFHHTASLGDRSSPISEDIIKTIVEQCKGFPLAITVVGRSLAGQPIEMWKKKEIEWSKGSLILDSETELLFCLQSSLDALDEELKECFLDLGSFPEDKQIPVAALMDMWAESFYLDEDALCIAKLQELNNRSLANLVDTRKKKMEGEWYYNEHFVTQHDLLRELTIYHSRLDDAEDSKRLIIEMCGNNLPNWWKKQKYQPIKARLLSISTDEKFTTWPDIQLPDAEVLVLNFQTKKYALPQSLKKMKKLKVLIVTNDGFSRAELSNFQLLGWLSNLKRIRLERISSIPFITMNPTQLSSVKKISLCNCNIRHAFGNGSIRMSDAFSNLQEMNIENDFGELPAEICDLVHLKKLCITNCFWLSILPERIRDLVNLEVLRLRHCTDLKELPDSLGNLKMLYFLDLSGSFSIKELPKDIGEMSSLRKLDIRCCRRFEELPVSILDLTQLEEVICDEDTKQLCGRFSPGRKNVRIVVTK